MMSDFESVYYECSKKLFEVSNRLKQVNPDVSFICLNIADLLVRKASNGNKFIFDDIDDVSLKNKVHQVIEEVKTSI